MPTPTGHETAAVDIPRARAALISVGAWMVRAYQYQALLVLSPGIEHRIAVDAVDGGRYAGDQRGVRGVRDRRNDPDDAFSIRALARKGVQRWQTGRIGAV